VSSGIANYAGRLGVNEQDVFGVIYLVFLCACGVLLVVSILVGAIMHVKSLASKDEEGKEVWTTRRRRWGHMSSNNTLRLVCGFVYIWEFQTSHFINNIPSC
jgi:hypothetical protein